MTTQNKLIKSFIDSCNYCVICSYGGKVVHMVLYENEPDEFNLNFLREELSIDPEFGLENIAHETGMWIREHPDITGLVHIYERVWRNHEV